jgi:multidrug efflux system membrane fusion protein
MHGEIAGLQKSRHISRGAVVAAVAIGLVAAIVIAAHVAAKNSNPPPSTPAPAPVPVGALTVEPRAIDLVKVGLGVVTAWNMAAITPQVSGKLIDVPLPEGTEVRAGEVLAHIDPKPFQATLDEAVAKKAQDEAQLTNAELDLQRYTKLVSSSAGTQQQLDTQRALVGQLKAQVSGDQASINSTQIQLDYTNIKAPFAGVVGIRNVDVGNVVSTTSMIVSLTEIEPIAVIFSLPQADLGVLQTGMRHGELPILAYEQQGKAVLGKGKLDVINNAIDQTTGTIKLKARFDNKNHALWPGQFVQVRVVTSTEPSAIAVPSAAVQRGPNGQYVWVISKDQTVHLQLIALGQIQDGQTVITRGLSAGDQIVVSGQFRLTQGAHISVTASPAVPIEPPAVEAQRQPR